MSGRPKRKKASVQSYADAEVIDVDVGVDGVDVDAKNHGGNQSQRGKKRSRQEISASSENQRADSLLNTHPHSQLPSYLSEAFSDLYSQDGLVVMGRGLGWLGLLCSFVRFYGDTENGYAAASDEDDDGADQKPPAAGLPGSQKQKKKPPLIFVLNLRENERQVLISTLASWGTPTDELPTIITNEAGQKEERAVMYARGGTFVITSRILIVDLLTGVANARDIEGMLVAHAEKVVGDKSMEAFILRIYRSQRYFMNSIGGGNGKSGFIKAFTDDPSGVVRGFARVDKILKALQVQRLYLYPRFHAAVAEELERQPPTVVELEVELSDDMKDIQNTLAAAIMSCLRDLRQKCHQVDLSFLFEGGSSGKRKKLSDTADNYGLTKRSKKSKGDSMKFTIQQCLGTNFAYILGRQLDGDWHRLSWDVRQRISDLRTIGSMFHYLIEYDCVQFWKLLQGIKAMSLQSKHQADWMLTKHGEQLFKLAKERVFKLEEGKLKRVLEAKPKETLLHQVLTEIENRWNARKQKAEERKEPITTSANVLLMVKDERALQSVTSFLQDGGGDRGVMKNFLSYLDQVQEKVQPRIRPGGLDLDSLPVEQRLLYEEHSTVHKILFGPAKINQLKQVEEEDRKKQKRKNRKIIEEKTRGMVTGDAIRQKALLEEAIEESGRGMTNMFQRIDTGDELSDDGSVESCSSDDEGNLLAYKVEPIEGLSLFIRTFSKLGEGEATLLLNDIQPKYVVMYDSEETFIRSLEIYSNSMVGMSQTAILAKEDRLQVFFLLYSQSAEEINFLKSLEREKDAFNNLIDHKKRMPTSLPTFNNFSTQEMQCSYGGVGGSYAGGKLPLSMDTRTGGGKQKTSKERRDIAVDVREFRSALPSVLHQGGMRLAPATLTVGDFVLTNVHCVERKSLSDLFGSLSSNSGRLFDQAEAMVKHYKCPCLLIEFDPEKSFCLLSTNDLGSEIRNDSIISKLTLLTMKFPLLRILWSRSPHETLKIFKKLKRNHQEVDVDKAIEIGSNESLDDMLLGGEGGYYNEDDENDEANDAAKKMLLCLPGVNVHNARKIMSECDSIAELAELSREELRRIAGPVAGQKLYNFFRQNFQA